jgi:hypothetical protein
MKICIKEQSVKIVIRMVGFTSPLSFPPLPHLPPYRYLPIIPSTSDKVQRPEFIGDGAIHELRGILYG